MHKAVFTSLILFSLATPAFSQQQCDLSGSPTNSLRTPLIIGAPSTPTNMAAPVGQAPAIGDGAVPCGVTPGMTGPSTLLPYHSMTPANSINSPSYVVPFNPATLSTPGSFGPSTYAPAPPSTPGYDPGMVHGPMNFRSPPVSVVPINPGGGIYGSAPTQKWGGQTSTDFGRYRTHGTRKFDFGQQEMGSCSQDGPNQMRPGAVPTQDLYGRRFPARSGMPTTQTIAPY